MITRNLHNYFMHHITQKAISVRGMSGSTFNVPVMSGLGAWLYMGGLSTELASVGNGWWDRTIRIGTGTTGPSYEDYNLESMIQVAPKSITSARSTSYENSYDITTATFLNETDADWIVTEVGEYIATEFQNTSKTILLAREVFDPVTVKPGQTFSVSMKLF